MGALKNLETPSRLFGSITDRTRPFLNRLSETNYLAVTNFQKAADQYLELVRQTLEFSEKRLVAVQRYSEPYHSVKKALEASQLSSEMVDALRSFRSAYVHYILKPAMKEYMSGSGASDSVETLYESALQIDGLLEVVQFFGKVQKP